MKGVTSVKKLAAISAALVIAAAGLSGCASQSAASSAEATRENPMILSLAHGLSETHTVHIAMTEFAQNVEELTVAFRVKCKNFSHKLQKRAFKRYFIPS